MIGTKRSAAGLLLCLWAGATAAQSAIDVASGDDALARGAYLLNAGGCIACHTAEDGEELAGGRPLVSPFGTFYAPNITADPVNGIGNWTEEQFVRAFQEGISPQGTHYYPAFPYTSYTGISATDLEAIQTYILSRPGNSRANQPHDLVWYASWRLLLAIWKALYFRPVRFEPEPQQTDSWNRGAYLVRHLGHCGECHTPRNALGAMRADKELSGAPGFGEAKAAPNITPDQDGTGQWSNTDWEIFLEIGMLPNGDFAGGEMGVVVDENTALLTAEDRATMIEYLRSARPVAND